MRVINQVEELLTLPGKRIGFFGGSFNPPHFGHLDFIKKAASVKNLDHIVVCPRSEENEKGLTELKHRMRIMDLMLETSKSSDIFVLSPEVCSGIQNKIFIDDIFYLMKRRQKEIYVLMGCDSFQECADYFKSIDVTFIVGCRMKRTDAERQLIAQNMKCIFIDDIIPCSADDMKDDIEKRNIYLSKELQDYIETNKLYWVKNDCENCN